MSSIQQIRQQRSYYYVYLFIYKYPTCDWQITLTRVNNNKIFILHDNFFFNFKLIYISNISSLYNTENNWANNLKQYVTACFQIRSWFILSIFFDYVPGLYIYFFLCVEIFHLLQIRVGVRIYCKLIPDWIKLTPSRILLTSQYITKSEILLGEVFRKYHRVNRKTASLYFDYLIATASIVFSPRLLPKH